MSLLDRLLGRSPGSNDYATAKIGERRQYARDVPGVLLRVVPHAENGGMADMAGVLQSVHNVTTDRLGKNTSPHHSYELVFDGQTVTFRFMAASDRDADAFRRRIASNYANSQVTPVVPDADGFPPIEEDDHVAGATLSLRRHTYYPIRHRSDADGFEDGDPYSEITSEMLSDEETRVVAQVVFKPALMSWTEADGLLGRGESVDDVAESLRDGTVKGWLNPRVRDASSKEKAAAKIVEQQRGALAFHTNIRVLAASPDAVEAEARARGVAELFMKYYNAPTEQGFDVEPVGAGDMGAHVEQMLAREYREQDMILTVDELASAAHVPNAEIETPRIDWLHQQSGGRVPAGAERGEEGEDR